MQVNRFHNGGYCIHKITGHWKGNVSAWFDCDGNLLECERIPIPFGPAYHVARNTSIWQVVAKIGQRYKHIPCE